MLSAVLNKITFSLLPVACLTLPLHTIAEEKIPNMPTTQFVGMDVDVPVGNEYDWVQLTSNEMLKGTIKHLYDDNLVFESDKVGVLTIDWADVRVLQSKGPVSIGFTDLSTRTGRLLIQHGKGYLDGKEFNLNEVLTIIAGGQQEANYWSSTITLGANFREGNTDQIDYSAKARVSRRTTESRFRTDYLGNYAKSDDEKTANNHRLNSHFDWFLSHQFYLRPVFGEYYSDPFSNIKSRFTIGSGIGYNFIDTSKTEWSLSGGPAYTFTQFDEVEVGETDNEDNATLVFESAFSTELTDSMDYFFDYRMQLGNEDSGGYTHHAITGILVELTDTFKLDLSLVWDRTEKPRTNADGTIPEKDDYQLIIGFGVDF